MAMYGCIYFDGDKNLSIVLQSKCIDVLKRVMTWKYHGRTRKAPNKFG